MADRPNPCPLGWAALILQMTVLAAAGYGLLFTTFKAYDDEGYLLLSLRNFAQHGGLYDDVYTQYGPLPYLLHHACHRWLGLEFTNDGARWITLVYWLATAAACALLTFRLTRSALWAAAALTLTFAHVWVMVNEPLHPGGLLACGVALASWVGVELWNAGWMRAFAVAMGIAAAALALTKVNVGALFVLAVVSWLALHTPASTAGRRIILLLVTGVAALLPWALMGTLLSATWVRLYALVFTCAALPILAIAAGSGRHSAGPRMAWWFGAAAATAATLVSLGVLVRGTSLQSLLEGVVLGPLRHPQAYSFAMEWRTGTATLAVTSLAFAIWFLSGERCGHPRVREGIVWARVGLTAAFLCVPLHIVSLSQVTWAMSCGLSLAWIFAVPLGGDSPHATARAWLAVLLVFQSLQGYPVAGSQINWATFLFVPLMLLGLREAAPFLRMRCGSWSPRLARTGLAAVAAVTAFMAIDLARIAWQRHAQTRPLQLPGAERLRLPPQLRDELHVVVNHLRTHVDMLFSLPGIYSMNLWTELPTPTRANATHWFSLLTPAQQNEIIARLAATPRAGLLVQRDVVAHLAAHGVPLEGPLLAWLHAHFRPVLKLSRYEIWLRQDSALAPPPSAAARAPAQKSSPQKRISASARPAAGSPRTETARASVLT